MGRGLVVLRSWGVAIAGVSFGGRLWWRSVGMVGHCGGVSRGGRWGRSVGVVVNDVTGAVGGGSVRGDDCPSGGWS